MMMETAPASFKILRPASDNGLAWDVIAIMWDHVEHTEDEDAYKTSILPATKGQLAIYACTWYLSEVNNGGHFQFFSNPTGIVLEDAQKGFQMLKATGHLNIITETISVFPDSSPSKNREEREEQLDSVDTNALDKLDERLHHLDENFDALATEYILSHPDEFFVES